MLASWCLDFWLLFSQTLARCAVAMLGYRQSTDCACHWQQPRRAGQRAPWYIAQSSLLMLWFWPPLLLYPSALHKTIFPSHSLRWYTNFSPLVLDMPVHPAGTGPVTQSHGKQTHIDSLPDKLKAHIERTKVPVISDAPYTGFQEFQDDVRRLTVSSHRLSGDKQRSVTHGKWPAEALYDAEKEYLIEHEERAMHRNELWRQQAELSQMRDSSSQSRGYMVEKVLGTKTLFLNSDDRMKKTKAKLSSAAANERAALQADQDETWDHSEKEHRKVHWQAYDLIVKKSAEWAGDNKKRLRRVEDEFEYWYRKGAAPKFKKKPAKKRTETPGEASSAAILEPKV